MIKSFFVGLGVSVAVLWGFWGFGVGVWHGSIGPKGNWWGLWEWVSVAPLLLLALWGIGWVFIIIGEAVMDGRFER